MLRSPVDYKLSSSDATIDQYWVRLDIEGPIQVIGELGGDDITKYKVSVAIE